MPAMLSNVLVKIKWDNLYKNHLKNSSYHSHWKRLLATFLEINFIAIFFHSSVALRGKRNCVKTVSLNKT